MGAPTGVGEVSRRRGFKACARTVDRRADQHFGTAIPIQIRQLARRPKVKVLGAGGWDHLCDMTRNGCGSEVNQIDLSSRGKMFSSAQQINGATVRVAG